MRDDESLPPIMNLVHLRSEWAPNVTRELLAGAVVALALIPRPSPSRSSPVSIPRSASTLLLYRRGHRIRRRPPGDDLRRHRRHGAPHGRPREGPRRRLPVRRHHPHRAPADRRRGPAPGQPDAVRLAVGGLYGYSSTLGDPDLPGADARATLGTRHHGLRLDRRWPRHHLRAIPLAVLDQGSAITAGDHSSCSPPSRCTSASDFHRVGAWGRSRASCVGWPCHRCPFTPRHAVDHPSGLTEP